MEQTGAGVEVNFLIHSVNILFHYFKYVCVLSVQNKYNMKYKKDEIQTEENIYNMCLSPRDGF